MRKVALILAVFSLAAGMGAAAPAHAATTPAELVFDGSTLTPAAAALLRNPIQEVPYYLHARLWATTTAVIDGVTVQAGQQLTREQYHAMTLAQRNSLNLTETRPSNAIVSADEAATTKAVDKVRRAGRVFPKLGSFASAGLQIAIAVAAGTAYDKALKMEIPGQGSIYRLITGESYSTVLVGSVTGYSWRYQDTGSTVDYSYSTNPAWYALAHNSAGAVLFDFYCLNEGPYVPAEVSATLKSLPNKTAQPLADNNEGCAANDMTLALRSNEQMEDVVNVKPTDAATYAGTTNKYSTTYSLPTFTTTDNDNMATTINNMSEPTRTKVINSIAEQISPGSTPETAPGTAANPTYSNPTGPVTIDPGPYDPPGPLDFSPLVPEEACDKFPFGVFCWMAEQVETIVSITPEAPVITLGSANLGEYFGIEIASPEVTLDAAELDGTAAMLFKEVVDVCIAFFVALFGYWGARRLMIGSRAEVAES